MTTSRQQTLQFTEDTLMCLPEDFHASHTVRQGNDLEKKMTATSGRKCLERFGKLSRGGSWAKTFPGLLLGQKGWFSTRCRLTWKLKGTKYRRMYFQLFPSTLPIGGTGFGLLPTPRVMDGVKGTDRKLTYKDGKWQNLDKHGTIYGMTLEQALRPEVGLLPTPDCSDRRSANSEQQGLSNVVKLLKTPCTADAYSENLSKKEQKFGNSGILAQEIQSGFVFQRGILPTPATRDYKGCNSDKYLNRDTEGNSHMDQLPNFIKSQTGETSQLNPRFVAEMMGFPPDWLELPFQSTETNPSKPTGTP